jgi:hypothetical protein
MFYKIAPPGLLILSVSRPNVCRSNGFRLKGVPPQIVFQVDIEENELNLRRNIILVKLL